MSDYETVEKNKISEGGIPSEKVQIPIVKYFWMAGPFGSNKRENLPKFLRDLEVFKNFSDNELRLLSKFFHLRKFEDGEVVFRQGNQGIGFYIIYSGHVDVIVAKDENDPFDSANSSYVLSLDRGEYFGELALLQENSIRNASVVAKDQTTLLGIFKPDIEQMIQERPIIAAKLLQTVSMIIANRLYSITQEVRSLKTKVALLEKHNAVEDAQNKK